MNIFKEIIDKYINKELDFDDFTYEIDMAAKNNKCMALYHCSNDNDITEIYDSFKSERGYDFGGIFCGYTPDDWYGKHKYLVIIKVDDFCIAENSDIQSSILFDNLDDGEIKRAVGDEDYCTDSDDDTWKAQCIRSRIAKSEGFASVTSGDGITVFAGSPIFKIS